MGVCGCVGDPQSFSCSFFLRVCSNWSTKTFFLFLSFFPFLLLSSLLSSLLSLRLLFSYLTVVLGVFLREAVGFSGFVVLFHQFSVMPQ